jgi:plastocyanin
MKEFLFQPATVEVAVGGTVTWTNADPATHTVKGQGWGSGDLAQGAAFSNKFDTAGTFAYSCGVHPSMTGEVIVK